MASIQAFPREMIVTGRRPSFAAPASRPRIDGRAGARGQILAATAISLIAVCALVAIAADLGYFFDYRRRMQTGADAAAMAGAEQLRREGNAKVVDAAVSSAASNGFTDGASGAEVMVHSPPTSGYYAGNGSFVEAVISQPRPTMFMGILGVQSARVSTRAVAGVQDSPNCIYAMDPTAAAALNASGGGAVNAACGIMVDSNSGTALSASGGGSVTSTASISVTGNSVGCCFSPTPRTGTPREPDPLAGRAAPDFSGCTYTKTQITSSRTLSPGVYCDGIDISGGVTVTFLPGLYVLNGGGLSVSGNSTLQGTGVTFYNTGGGGYAYKPVGISGGTIGSLSAPTSGPMEGILFFQDRAITSNQTNSISGGSTLSLEGALYFPTTPLDFSGNSAGTANYTVIVASTIKFTGASVINANFSSLANRNPVKKISLAE